MNLGAQAIVEAFAVPMRQIGKTMLAAQAEIERQAVRQAASIVPPVMKIDPPKISSVGPRPVRQYDRRGRRKY